MITTLTTISKKKIEDLLSLYPFLDSFFDNTTLDLSGSSALALDEYFSTLDEEELEDKAIDTEHMKTQIAEYIDQMISFLGEEKESIDSVTILPGTDKSGDKENFEQRVLG